MKKLLWGALALVLIGAGIGLMSWVSTTAKDLKATASEAPQFLPGTPSAYVYDYVQGDFKGERLESANWERYKQLVIWPSEPNWESAYVIRAFRVQSGPVTGRDASIDVTYDTLGELNLHTFTYESSPSRQTVPFLMVPRQDRWKVGTPILRPHVGPEAAIAHLERMKVHHKPYRANIDRSIARLRAEMAARP